MNRNCSNYEMDDFFIRTFMPDVIIPAKEVNKIYPNSMYNSTFCNEEEGFLKGNMEKGTYIPYKNMTYIKPVINDERQALLYKISENDFACDDINLYLDTHPNDLNAINLYGNYNKQVEMLTKEYERRYGSINLSDNEGLANNPWKWLDRPWPWCK